MNQRYLVAGGLLAAASLSLASCGGKTEPTNASTEVTNSSVTDNGNGTTTTERTTKTTRENEQDQ